MALLSALYLPLAGILLSHFNSIGLVVANLFNLLSRYTYSVVLIQQAKYVHIASQEGHELDTSSQLSLLPHSHVILSLTLSAIVTNSARRCMDTSSTAHHLVHTMLGTICLLFVLACTVYKERELVSYIRELRHPSKYS